MVLNRQRSEANETKVVGQRRQNYIGQIRQRSEPNEAKAIGLHSISDGKVNKSGRATREKYKGKTKQNQTKF